MVQLNGQNFVEIWTFARNTLGKFYFAQDIFRLDPSDTPHFIVEGLPDRILAEKHQTRHLGIIWAKTSASRWARNLRSSKDSFCHMFGVMECLKHQIHVFWKNHEMASLARFCDSHVQNACGNPGNDLKHLDWRVKKAIERCSRLSGHRDMTGQRLVIFACFDS